MSGDNKDWNAPIELAGKIALNVGHTHDEIVEMEAIARSLEWKVTPHEPCKECERIKAKPKK